MGRSCSAAVATNSKLICKRCNSSIAGAWRPAALCETIAAMRAWFSERARSIASLMADAGVRLVGLAFGLGDGLVVVV